MATFPPQPQKTTLPPPKAESPVIEVADNALNIAEVQEVEAEKPLDLMPPNPDATGPYITYTGMATLRQISKSDWKKAGVEDQGDVEWNAINGYRISVNDLSEKAINYCLNVDGRFSKVDD